MRSLALTTRTDIDKKVPCVVMAHGFSLTRHDGLAPYAEAFARAGAAALIYDHRFIGDSEGEPRQRIQPAEQLEDRRSAVAFARTLDGIDPDRIVVWGYSMSARNRTHRRRDRSAYSRRDPALPTPGWPVAIQSWSLEAAAQRGLDFGAGDQRHPRRGCGSGCCPTRRPRRADIPPVS